MSDINDYPEHRSDTESPPTNNHNRLRAARPVVKALAILATVSVVFVGSEVLKHRSIRESITEQSKRRIKGFEHVVQIGDTQYTTLGAIPGIAELSQSDGQTCKIKFTEHGDFPLDPTPDARIVSTGDCPEKLHE